MAKQSTWVITTSQARSLPAVARAVAADGGSVQSQLTELGVLVAQGSSAMAARWRKLPGVAAVQADAGVNIGPPDADPS